METPNNHPIPAAEGKRIDARRKALFGEAAPTVAEEAPWALSLSGGGIRSATFSLGVVQALAQAEGRRECRALSDFDYLSTVSGGGYTGAFLGALFRDPRSRGRDGMAQGVSPKDARDRHKWAMLTLADDPPGRMDKHVNGKTNDYPLRWLRENGRYMAPTGAGDLLYAGGLVLRNWCAVHYVLGITLLLLAFLGFGLRAGTQAVPFLDGLALRMETLTQPLVCDGIWWSPWWFMTLGVAVLGLIPLGVAYWFSHESSTAGGDGQPSYARAVFYGLCLAALLALAGWAGRDAPGKGTTFALWGAAAEILLAIAWFQLSQAKGRKTTSERRVWLTTMFAKSLGWMGVLALLALIETASQSLYLYLHYSPGPASPTVVSIMAALAVAIPATRKLAESASAQSPGGWLSKLPIDAVLGVVAVLLLLALATGWHLLALTLIFQGAYPWLEVANGEGSMIANAFRDNLPYTSFLIAVIAAGTLAAGYFIGFINLSSLATLYSARLTRAYLGASNKERFQGGDERLRRVTEPHPKDDFTWRNYYCTCHLGPLHVINVTVNQTAGREGALVQLDRKGQPLAVLPWGLTINGEAQGDGGEALTIGQWTAISGAAFTSGLGRGTSPGKAAVFTLTNIRLGYWWQSPNRDARFNGLWEQYTRSQRYLLRELTGRFFGNEGRYWYLSDGGHFENTAVYEMLRRRCALVVACDDGADPEYTFEDLANLMRLARIDFGAEFRPLAPQEAVECLTQAGLKLHPDAASRIAPSFEAFRPAPARGLHCALAYYIEYDEGGPPTLLLVIKPRLVDDAPLDLHEYRSRHPTFPQETTFDQFFDEAQWESYRKLGSWIGSRLFAVP